METSVAMRTLEREIVLLDFHQFSCKQLPQIELHYHRETSATHGSIKCLRRSVLEPQFQHTQTRNGVKRVMTKDLFLEPKSHTSEIKSRLKNFCVSNTVRDDGLTTSVRVPW